MKKLFAILMALSVLLAVGCAAAPKSSAEQAAAAPAQPAAPAPMAMDNTSYEETAQADTGAGAFEGERGGNSGMADQYGGHKVIATYNLEMETDSFDEHYSLIMAKVKELGGYVQDSSLSGTKPETYNDYGRNANFTFRIPSGEVEAFVEFAGGTGKLTYNNKSTQDVTLDYYDSETRLDVLRTQLDRLKSILVETDNLADIVELEKAIAEVTIEIEQMTTQLRRYDDLIDYSTVYLYMREDRLTSGPAATQTVGERISKGFASNLSGVGVFLENFFVWFVSSLPVLLLLGLIALVAALIVRRVVRRRNGPGKEPKQPKSNVPAWIKVAKDKEDKHEKE